jgi:hypothetical protein
MNDRNIQVKRQFPLWQYLNQLLNQPTTIINPFQFWYKYRIQQAEICWNFDNIIFLEICWKLNCLNLDRACSNSETIEE